MELRSGFPLFLQQFKSLLKKNLLLSWRNKRATLLQILSPLFFIFLIFAIDRAIRANNLASSVYKSVKDPPAIPISPITPCEDKFFIKRPCYDFVWSGDDNPKFHTIVQRIMDNNPGRPIHPAASIPGESVSSLLLEKEMVKSFKDKFEVDAWLLSNPLRCPGAIHFRERNNTVISYGLQTNSTAVQKRGRYEDSTNKFQLPLQLAAEREIARYLIGDSNLSWNVFLKEFAHPAKPPPFSSVGLIGPSFFLAIAMFNFVLQMSSLVTEKELKLRQIVVEAGVPYLLDFSKTFRIIWSFFPPNTFAQALQVLSSAVQTPEDHALRWSDRGKCAPYDFCYLTINDIYKWLLGTFFVWFVLAIYFDNIIPNACGVRKSIFYFLHPGYWLGKGGQKVKEGGICSCLISAPHEEHSLPDDEDVRQEENIVKHQLAEGVVDANVAVQIYGLSKTYPGTMNIGCCCKCKRTRPYSALKGLWVNFAKDQLFCLLGPNGAGKTTAISCLTGITPVTNGDALIYGHSIRSPSGMSSIRKLIGFDILWDALSGEEHLELFATIKGLSPNSIKSVAQTSLGEVRLTEASKVRAGSYSGGMKRRLSVAIALIGDPKLVILDEPTTGMDPITRRHVWDIIENAKKGRAIILTTHSMEEADILSDRIGIMAKGRLRCIGTSIRLKSRFGSGFIANISFYGVDHSPALADGYAVSATHREAVKQFFKNRLNVKPKEENNKFLTFVIPHDREELLMNFFSELQYREVEFGISDIQLGLTTLEEVFLNIAKQAELESAEAEGSLVTLSLTSGESVEIPKGARFVGIPGTQSAESPTGYMVEVYWDQDDTGALCISGHSQKVPIPSGIELPSSPATRNHRRLGQIVHGVVIDPSLVSEVIF
ncbi:unnamed protein product [Lupinus luteus]|uniref:ABC transporter domain-containing protein n=1 Tax=Lupinus luteus TaxID=3873 RepID=A0AAV1XEL5_LUPLU